MKTKILFLMFPSSRVLRWYGLKAEGLPGLHALSAAQRCHTGPGGAGENNSRCAGRLPGSLQHLRRPLPEWWALHGGKQQLLLWLQPICLHWSLLWKRWGHLALSTARIPQQIQTATLQTSFFNPHFASAEVSAGFKSGTSVSYTFQEASRNSSSSSNVLPSSVYPDTSLRAENILLNFRTSHSPALLLYVSSYRREYLALLLNQHGERKPHEEYESRLKPWYWANVKQKKKYRKN